MTVTDNILFPPIEPSRSGYLAVDSIHKIYWEECGNPAGVPVLFLHGGPGAGCDDWSRRFFDAKAYRILLFDQRGAKRSQPLGETERNNPDQLLSDMEALRATLGVDAWHLFGGSWGSTLALLYAQTYPQHSLSLTLRGVSFFETEDLDWWFRGMRAFFPELWHDFAAFASSGSRELLEHVYYDAIRDDDPRRRLQAVMAIHAYASGCSSVLSPFTPSGNWDDPDYTRQMTAFYKLFLHYSNHYRLETGRLLRGVARMAHLPGVIVQGRCDMVCPAITAFRLHQAWPRAEYVVVPDGSHSSKQPSMAQALINATDRFKSRF